MIDPAFKQKLERLAESHMLPMMAVSIRAAGEASKSSINAQSCTIVESFTAVRSVDFVTFAGAGGQVDAIESDTTKDKQADVKASLYESY